MKHFNSKATRLFGMILIPVICIVFVNVQESNTRSEEEIIDMRARTAIYQALALAMPNSTPSIRRTAPSTYHVPLEQSFAPELLEEAMVNNFKAQDLSVNIELGLFNVEDDSLVYGKSINYGVLFSPTKNKVHVENGNLVIHISQSDGTLLSRTDYMAWLTIILLLIGVLAYFSRKGLVNLYQSVLSSITSTENISQVLPQSVTQKVGNFEYDEKNLLLIHPSGERQLTYKEGKLLGYFFGQPNTLLERKQILEHVWEEDGFFVARSMDVFISKLRKYLSVEAGIKIDNVRGVGYMLKC